MNLVEALERVRAMLAENGAQAATLRVVDGIRANADRIQGGGDARAQSLLQITRMLLRTPAASQNVRIYNDLALLEQQLAERAEVAARERETELDRPMPKDKKFYKARKEREQRAKQS